MSNLTSASGHEASVSSNQPSIPNHNDPNPLKKKRSLPGNPDPEAEVVALSPKSLLATNRFMCEICNKGFKRDQNLQLHRRGHNLPWKLKQRGSKEVRKKVYVCPEKTCVHHDPARALGDLTGIKKHFCRKHGEKRWKCDKCSKKYAVQSDWKAHSKTCGTKEYRCDCGTLFSRRDSFITHRAFCDALAEESARVISSNPMPIHHPPFLLPQPTTSSSHDHHTLRNQTLKREQQRQDQNLTMGQQHVQLSYLNHSSHQLQSTHIPTRLGRDMPQDPTRSSLPPLLPHMSATALLQRAARMGATMHRTSHMATSHTSTSCSAPSSSRFGVEGFVHEPNSPAMHGVMIPSSSATSGFDGSFEDGFGEMFGGKRGENLEGGGSDDGYLTRDFLGLTNLSHSDILNFAGLGSSMSSQYKQGPHQSSNEPWQ